MKKIKGFIKASTIKDIIMKSKELEIAEKEASNITQLFYFAATEGRHRLYYWTNEDINYDLVKAILTRNGYYIRVVQPQGQWLITVD